MLISTYKFLIQSDFITSANQEDIIDCPWNDTIVETVATVFSAAISVFARTDSPMQFAWLDYLPNTPMSGSWELLYRSIQDHLKLLPVIRTREKRQLKTPDQVRWLPYSFLHEGEPLFADLREEDLYIAPDYAPRHKETLTNLGVRIIGWDDVLERLREDSSCIQSRLKTKKPTDPWHEALASLLLRPWEQPPAPIIQQRIKKLGIIPLVHRNQWRCDPSTGIGGRSKNIYFSYTDSIPIPDSLAGSIDILDRTASKSPRRRNLYKLLGVTECPKELVIASIKKVHTGEIQRPPATFASPELAELRYLFYFYEDIDELKLWAKIPTETGHLEDTSLLWYLPSDYEYSLYKLLPEEVRRCSPSRDYYRFMGESLVNLVSPTVQVRGLSWRAWLEKLSGANTRPPLTIWVDHEAFLSPAMELILEHNPTKFLSTLKAHWDHYQWRVRIGIENIKDQCVPCRSGTSHSLDTTFLPTVEILAKIKSLQLDEADFPLLDLPGGDLDQLGSREWQFLEELVACTQLDLNFYKSILKTISGMDELDDDVMTNVYESMAKLATVDDHVVLRYGL